MSNDLTNLITIFIDLFALGCFLYTMYVLKAKNESLKDTNADLKSLLEVINVERIKKITEWEQEAHIKAVESRISEFVKDQLPNIEKITKPQIDLLAKTVEETIIDAMGELFPFVFSFLDGLPKEERQKYIEENFKYHKTLLLDFFKDKD